MRARNLKPGFFKNEQLAECQPLTRILFQGLWCLADREGRLEDRPMRIKADVFPYDNCDIDAMLDELAARKDTDGNPAFILRYQKGKKYIQVLHFRSHQNPHVKEVASTIPAPDKYHTSTSFAPDKHEFDPAESPLLNPHSLKPETITRNPETNDLKEVIREIQGSICMVTSQVELDLVKDWTENVPRQWISEAVKIAALKKVRNLKYVDSILVSWAAKFKPEEKPWEAQRSERSEQPKSHGKVRPGFWATGDDDEE